MLKVFNFSYKYHLLIALFIRFILIIYGEFHDKHSEVPYTDIDYRVFTDASRHIVRSNSPYNRHTYRYSPLLAIILTPNIILNNCFGKFFFSIIDIIVGILIRILVEYTRKNYVLCKKTIEKHSNLLQLEDKADKKKSSRKKKLKKKKKYNDKEIYDYIPDYCMYFWLYNPLSIIISTRGNCDTLAVILVLLTLYFLQCKRKYFTAGLIHGLAIHFRLYPLMYSLSYYMFLSKFSKFNVDGLKKNENIFNELNLNHNQNMQIAEIKNNELIINEKDKRKTIFKKKYLHYLIPNKEQIKLVFGTLISVFVLTALFYYLYGYKFLYETYVYHLIRKDTRHNFSLFFYLQYLTSGVKNIGMWQKTLCILPQIILLLVLSVRYGLNRFTLHFSLLTQTIVMVAYNSVLTSQYFIWIIGLFPLCLWQLDMTFKNGLFLVVIWFVAQLAWLLPAYLLEFLGRNTFLFVWLQCVSFFCANMAVLGRLIKCFMYKVD